MTPLYEEVKEYDRDGTLLSYQFLKNDFFGDTVRRHRLEYLADGTKIGESDRTLSFEITEEGEVTIYRPEGAILYRLTEGGGERWRLRTFTNANGDGKPETSEQDLVQRSWYPTLPEFWPEEVRILLRCGFTPRSLLA